MPGPALRLLYTLIAFLLLAAPPAAADVVVRDADLARALAYFERGDHVHAAAELASMVESPRLTRAERLRAWEALGISSYVIGKLKNAEWAFRSLLREDPDYQPDAIFVPPEIVGFVLDIRRTMAADAATATTRPAARLVPAAMPPAGELPAAAAPAGTPILLPATLGTPFSAADLLPFGVGQYRRQQTGRGTTLLVLETLLLGTNIGLYYYRNCSLKETCGARYYPAENLDRARDLQGWQIVTGSLFVATATLGVIDGLMLPLTPNIAIQATPSGGGLQVTIP